MWISENNAGQYPCLGAEMPAGTTDNGMVSPEMVTYPPIYYILQPHILMACDQMEMYGCMMPTKQMMMGMCDQIYDQVCKMHPEMAQYDVPYPVSPMADPPMGFGFDEFGRRRGPFRDLLAFLLFSELLRRRRRY